jgi:hypothetical protein
MKYFHKQAALGIPDRKLRSKIPMVTDGQWDYGIQEHHAHKAGKHYDLRLGDAKNNKAYSWALRYLPKPGEKRLAIRQPDHTMKYMDFEGTIPEGYGAGEVKLHARGKASIHSSSPRKINFTNDGVKYTLIKTKDDSWLILNRG